MKKYIIIGTLILIHSSLSAQYYFKDIISTSQSNELLATYKKANIHQITLNSFETGGVATEGFFCQKNISTDYKKTTTHSHTLSTGETITESYYNNRGKCIKSYDSSEIASNTTLYNYNEEGFISSIQSSSVSKDDDYLNRITETHLYQYNKEHILQELQIIKNEKDTTIILFSADEKGNIILEKNTKTAAKYYYYYDNQNRLTDIAHINENTQLVLPDYTFDYDQAGQIIEMNTAEDNKGHFMTWKYDYEDGLKKQERLFSIEKKFLAKIVYDYK